MSFLLFLVVALATTATKGGVNAQGLFPAQVDFAKGKTIVATSTCGRPTADSFCEFFADFAASYDNCQTAVCNDTCPYGDDAPVPVDLMRSATLGAGVLRSNKRPSSPTSVAHAYFFNGSNVAHATPSSTLGPFRSDPGFTFSAWIFPLGSSRGDVISKSSSDGKTRFYAWRVLTSSLSLDYRPSGISSGYRTATLATSAVRNNRWSHVAVTVYESNAAFFVNGGFVGTVSLQNAILDGTGNTLIGQVTKGTRSFYGQMQEVYAFNSALSERSIQELYSGSLMALPRYSSCRCPPSHPRVDSTDTLRCTVLPGQTSRLPTSRLNVDAHPVEYAVDPSVQTRWQSKAGTREVNVTIDMGFSVLVPYLILQFYTPRPKAMVYEKSLDGINFVPLQYYADDCQNYFNMPDNGLLASYSAVNCLTSNSAQSPTSLGLVSFRYQDLARPRAPDYDDDPAVRQPVYASYVRFRMIDYFANQPATNEHLFYGIASARVLGRCECYGHSSECSESGTCICSHHTSGQQCDQCEPLYNDKPWTHGTTTDANPCIACECNNHATTCHYDASIDSAPSSRIQGSGGVCDNCLHNTAGPKCDRCATTYYRPSGRPVNATNACEACDCDSAGALGSDCAKDDSSTPNVLAGQCSCKAFVTGRKCDVCRDGYYDLSAIRSGGCRSCDCDVSGTVGGAITCHSTTGQCPCKTNVMGLRCDACAPGTHSLSAGSGCLPCACHSLGSFAGVDCNSTTGQCSCKRGVDGINCDRCAPGFFNLTSSGCEPCNCNSGSIDSVTTCNATTGQCLCKPNVVGVKCDACRDGFYDFVAGCRSCDCNVDGTANGSASCASVDGKCTCKKHVTGAKCDACVADYYNLSASNPDGCRSCACSSRGTVAGSTCDSVTGQCKCVANVIGRACDACATGFYLTNGQCASCNCHPQGSRDSVCDQVTGECTCLTGVGIGQRACDGCASGFFQFTGTSCTACQCNAAGSAAPDCDQTTGKCSCKQYVEGDKCVRCKAGFTTLAANNPFGCSAAPEEQGPPTLTALNDTAVRVAWTSPEKPNGIVTEYQVIRNSSRVVFRGVALSYVDTGLQPNSVYTYKIRATTAGGSTESVALFVKTLQGPPDGVSQPALSVVSSTIVAASWIQPAMPNGIVTKYELVDKTTTNRVLFSGLRFSFLITGLSPYSAYAYAIRACTIGGCTESPPAVVYTLEAAPASQPAPVLLVADVDRLTIGWAAPMRPNGVLDEYVVYRRDVPFLGVGRVINRLADTSVNVTTVTGLVPFTEYEFAVESSTRGGSTKSAFSRFRTAESVPLGVPPPVAVVLSSSSIRLSWSEAATPNGVVLRYRLYDETTATILHVATRPGQFVVSGLRAFTAYDFLVEVCTSAGCANSSTIRNQTFDAPPDGQSPPVVSSAITASSASFRWTEPAVQNGQITSYALERKAVSFSQANAVEGRYFEGNGYLLLSSNVFYGGYESTISLEFKTFNRDALLVYSGDSSQRDFVAIQLNAGRLYFIFDCGSGAGVVRLPNSSPTFFDGAWHTVVASRRGSVGTLTVDGVYSGSGSSFGSASVIGVNTGFHVGGLASSFRSDAPLPGDFAGVPVTTVGFSGGMRALAFGSSGARDLSATMSERNVRSALDGVPLLSQAGMHFKGGGYVVVDASTSPLGTRNVDISFRMRSEQQNGILVFAFSDTTSDFLAILLRNGDIRLEFDNGGGVARTTTDSSRSGVNICDGNWHSVRISKRDLGGEIFVDGFSVTASVNAPGSDFHLNSTSDIYVGGFGIAAAARAATLGVDSSHFGGCMQNLTIGGQRVGTVKDLSLVSLAGCPGVAQTSSLACSGGIPAIIASGLSLGANDTTMQPFTEYLYRVRSANRGGSTTSTWISVHSRDAAPSGVPSPTVLYESKSNSVSVSWTHPTRSNGIVTQYRLLFYSYHPNDVGVGNPTTAPPLVALVADPSTLSYTATNLSPYTTYQVVVEASTSAGSSQGAAASFTTSPSRPSGVSAPIAVATSRSLNFTWSEPTQPNGVIRLYELHVNGHSVYEDTQRQFLLERLTPFVKYTVQLFACTSSGCTGGPTTSISTAEDVPSGVPAPSLVAQGAQTVLATWSEPTAKNGIITRYELHLVTGSSSVVVFAGTARRATVQGLVAGTNYSFFVNASTSVGSAVGPSSFVVTLDDVPEGVSPPIVVAVDATSTRSTWTAPTKSNGLVVEYRLLENEKEIFRGLAFAYTSTSLEPYETYDYKVQACTSKGCGSSVPTTVRTLEAPPIGQPVPNVTIVNSTAVSVIFGEPTAPNGVVRYRLYVRGDVRTFVAFRGASGVDPAIIGDLLPFSNYTFWVEVLNGAGSTNSSTTTAMTHPDAPYGVVAPSVVVLNATAVRVTWQAPARLNGLLRGYHLDVEEHRLEAIRVEAGFALEAIVTSLKPFTIYNVSLTATSSGGATTSRSTSVTTAEADPIGFDRPTAVVTSARFVVVAWDLPSSPNGVITSYRVRIDGRLNVVLAGHVLTANVTNLLPFTRYLIEVEACNSAGCTTSEALNATTIVAVAQGVALPTLTSITARSIRVEWTKEDFSNGIVTAYYIQRKVSNSETIDVAKLSSSTFLYLDDSRDLTPYTTYSYRIKAENLAGNGTGAYANVTTKQAAPQGVSSPVASTRSSSSIDVLWSPPQAPNGVVTTYELTRIEVPTNQIVRRLFPGSRLATTATGLMPYTNYSFILAACTVAGCAESPSTYARTAEALATGLLPPKVSPRSSTSLVVSWTSPMNSNGVLLRYELERRNLDNPSSSSYEKVILIDNRTTSINDTALDVYHRYEYRVGFVNGAGATISVPSTPPVRTNADVPLAGPNVTATVVNHTSIVVSWTQPALKQLRGPLISYTFYYKVMGSKENATARSVGLATTQFLNDLQPNTDYEFTVSLDNGIGVSVSDAVVARTLDGAPEGVGRPTLRVLSATQIEVTWFEPTTPNGRIVSYSVARGGGGVVHNATTPSSVVVDGLEPFTTYTFTVTVCTVFDCVASAGATAMTSEATPIGMAAPTYVVLNARSVNVSWMLPSRPNGAITSYEVRRVPYVPCSDVLPTDDPSATPTKEQCTYVECPLLTHARCGAACYDLSTEVCCADVVHKSRSGFFCCDANYTTRARPNDVCCDGRFHDEQSGFSCCDGNYIDVPSGSVCCGGVATKGDACCDDRTAYDSSREFCCGGVVRLAHVNVKCCGESVVLKSKICCDGSAYDRDDAKTCCGAQYVRNETTLCCESVTGAAIAYAYASAVAKATSFDACCGTVRIKTAEACCNERGYDPLTHVCADRSTLLGSGQACGSGAVCPVADAASAYCDRCDFDINARACGTVDGKFAVSTASTPTGMPSPTSGPLLCAGKSRLVFSGLAFYVVDSTGLEPFSEYRYTVAALNNEGNATSLPSSVKTAEAAPDGVSAPSLKAIGSTEIEVKWTAPSQPNGIVRKYSLYRDDIVVVRQSSDFEFDDSALEPFTSYAYTLEACTTAGCANSSASSILTPEDVPLGVDAPLATPLSPYAIHLAFRSPRKPNGIILEFNIYVDRNVTAILAGSANEFNATSLQPFTTYSFEIEACTSVGCARSARVAATTLEAAPLGVAPPTLTVLSATSIDVQWTVPSTTNGVVLRYVLSRDGVRIFNGTRLGFTDVNLTASTNYVYRVTATTGGGSTTSDSAAIRTPEDTPEGLAKPRLTAVNSTAILVVWTSPAQPNGQIIGYRLFVDGAATNAGLKTSLIVDGFEPFTQHEFQVESCNSKGCARSQREVATTREAAPETLDAPVLVALGPTAIRVAWSAPAKPNGIITRYEVYRKATSVGSIEILIHSDNSSITSFINVASQLKPFSDYQYRVRAVNSAGSVYSSYAIVRTAEDVPTGLATPTIVVDGPSAVNVSWSPPSQPNGLIRHYVVRYRLFVLSGRPPVVGANVSGSEMTTRVVRLDPNTDYEFQVIAFNGAGSVESAWQLATTDEGCPEQLQLIAAVRSVDGTQLILSWNAPLKPNGNIQLYRLYADTVYTVSTRRFVYNRLTPFTDYRLQLEACTASCCARGINQTIRTAEVTPTGQNAPTLTSLSPNEVEIAWRPPSSPNGIVTTYEIYRRQVNSINAAAAPSLLVTRFVVAINSTLIYVDRNLSAFTRYQYGVVAVNSVGRANSSYADVQTGSASPLGVRPPTVRIISATSAIVSWREPLEPNGLISLYTVRRNGSGVHDTLATTFVDSALEPYTIYAYSIEACTAGGCTESAMSFNVTFEAAPAAVLPPNLFTINSSAIYANWSDPDQPNGIVTEYLVEYTGSSRRSVGVARQFVATNLAPYSLYDFYLTACTVGGCTTSSKSTVRSGPAAPEGLVAPLLQVQGSESILVSWGAPAVPNGVIDTYRLTRNDSVVYVGKDTRFQDSGLVPGSSYVYRYTVSTVGGTSTSPASVGRTNPDAPAGLVAPDVSPLSSTSVRVTWKAPARPNGVIVRYVVLVDGARRFNGTANDFAHVVTGLSPYSTHDFQIEACTARGCSVSDATSETTLEAAPIGQNAPSLVATARTVLATWSPPDSPNGVIVGYELRRRLAADFRDAWNLIYVGPATSFLDNDTTLRPYMRYEYNVTSLNGAGSASSPPTPIRLEEATPEGIGAPNVTNIGPYSFDVVVPEPTFANGIIVRYRVSVNGTVVASDVQNRLRLTQLKPFTVFDITGDVCTTAGCGASALLRVVTAEAAPDGQGEPITGAATSTSVVLTWNEPNEPNGIITTYTIWKRTSCPQPQQPFVNSSLCAESGEDLVFSVVVGSPPSLTFTAVNLKPYTTYQFRLTAMNSAGSALSPWSGAVTTLTDRPRYTGVSPSATVDGTSVTVDWSQSFEYNAEVRFFLIYENNNVVFQGPRRLEYTRHGLATGKKFTYHINVETDEGTAASSQVEITTGDSILTPTSRSSTRTAMATASVSLPTTSANTGDTPFYESVGFIIGIALAVIVILFIIVAICMRRSAPSEEQRRKGRKTHRTTRTSAYWAPQPIPLRGPSPAPSQTRLIDSPSLKYDRTLEWTEGVAPSESAYDDAKPIIIDSSSGYFTDDVYVAEHTTFSDTHL